jgi:hypothetical protein
LGCEKESQTHSWRRKWSPDARVEMLFQIKHWNMLRLIRTGSWKEQVLKYWVWSLFTAWTFCLFLSLLPIKHTKFLRSILIALKLWSRSHNQNVGYIYWTIHTHFKCEGQEGQTGPAWRTGKRDGELAKKMKECEYGGYILYSCMKIEQWNLLELF